MKETKTTNEFVAITYMSLFIATIVATVITQSALDFIGGLVGTVAIVKVLVTSPF